MSLLNRVAIPLRSLNPKSNAKQLGSGLWLQDTKPVDTLLVCIIFNTNFNAQTSTEA